MVKTVANTCIRGQILVQKPGPSQRVDSVALTDKNNKALQRNNDNKGLKQCEMGRRRQLDTGAGNQSSGDHGLRSPGECWELEFLSAQTESGGAKMLGCDIQSQVFTFN